MGVLAGTGLNYVQPDHLGTPRTVIDPMRDVAIWTWDIKGEAFGNTPPDQDADRDGTPFVFGMRFPGQRYDSATGLNQNYFRDYDAAGGRYAQSDPLGLHGNISSYSYSNGYPLSAVDLLGLCTEVVYWHGVGVGESQFGHISTNINGQNFSWGPPGQWDSKYPRASDYNALQKTFRDGNGVILNLTPIQESQLAACMSATGGKYSIMSNNCGTSVQDCLQKVGVQFEKALRPKSIFENLSRSPSAAGSTVYPGPPKDGEPLDNPFLWGF